MHPSASPQADLAGRRRRAGASRETMAAGTGIDIEDVRAIEEGKASAELSARYGQWLDRVEAWPAELRSQQFKVAGVGQRFAPQDP